MRQQGFRCVIDARQFRFAERGVDLLVADVMQKNGWPASAAFELGHKVVQGLRHTRRDRTVAERADRIIRFRLGLLGDPPLLPAPCHLGR